mgnify:FL=1
MINMLEKKEILVLLLITLVFAVTLSFLKMEIFAEVLLAVFIVLVLNIAAKKMAAF